MNIVKGWSMDVYLGIPSISLQCVDVYRERNVRLGNNQTQHQGLTSCMETGIRGRPGDISNRLKFHSCALPNPVAKRGASKKADVLLVSENLQPNPSICPTPTNETAEPLKASFTLMIEWGLQSSQCRHREVLV